MVVNRGIWDEVGEGVGGGEVVVADLEAAERSEVGAGAEALADVLGEGADVGAGAAMDTDFELGVTIF